MLRTEIKPAPFDQVLGLVSTDVPAYSNGEDDFFSAEQHYLHGICLGFKWQCVELVRRWLLMRKSCVFKDIRCAADIWTDLSSVERVTDGRLFPLSLHPNGSSIAPNRDSLLIYPRSAQMPFGHVAIVTDVGSDFVRVAEQNRTFYHWPGNYARQIPLTIRDSRFYIEDKDPVAGWVHIDDDDDQLTPLDQSKIAAVLRKYQQTQPVGQMQRSLVMRSKSIDTEFRIADLSWLGVSREEILDFGNGACYMIDQHLTLNIGSASNELHGMFLEATDRVIRDDNLLTHFCIPKAFWARIRRSWATERDWTMTGRFDLAFDGQQLKVFEYNADCAAALIECAAVQEEWAKTVDLPSRCMSAFQLHSLLVKRWKDLRIDTRVHLFIEEIPEERLTALYMQSVMREAGIDTKLCVGGTDDIRWKDSTIVDSDGQPVQLVWKLWMWETVFRDYQRLVNERGSGASIGTPIDGHRPRLSDILLNDRIRVIEPLWKVVTSNKALLPVLYSMFTDHPLLLRSHWTLTEELRKGAFVSKPIVGRCGHNVTLYNGCGDQVIEATQGIFADRNSIYQELFSLRDYDGFFPIIGSWIVGEQFAGLCIREDQKRITDGDSPVVPCCIVWND